MKFPWRALAWRSIVLACWSLVATAVHADFPDRPVHIVVPMPPGGLADTQARMIAEKLSNRWMRPVIIENRPGAGSTIAAAYVARSPADGYSLLLVGPSHVITIGDRPRFMLLLGLGSVPGFNS